MIDAAGIDDLKAVILATGLSVSDLVFTAFSAAVPFRHSDKRGGANGGRLALAPQKDWAVNRRTIPVIVALREVVTMFNQKQSGNTRVSLADAIVLGGCVGVEQAAAAADMAVTVPFTPGRRDTTQELTDLEMFEWLRPVADGFRNFIDSDFAAIAPGVAPEEMFLDKAQLLTMSVPQWTVLVGGLRVLGANHDGSAHGTFTDRVGVLTNDFFTVLTDTDLVWKPTDAEAMTFSPDDRATGTRRYTATRCDLVFGSNSQLRAVAEVYAARDGHTRLVHDFVAVWDKVMMLDRFDVHE